MRRGAGSEHLCRFVPLGTWSVGGAQGGRRHRTRRFRRPIPSRGAGPRSVPCVRGPARPTLRPLVPGGLRLGCWVASPTAGIRSHVRPRREGAVSLQAGLRTARPVRRRLQVKASVRLCPGPEGCGCSWGCRWRQGLTPRTRSPAWTRLVRPSAPHWPPDPSPLTAWPCLGLQERPRWWPRTLQAPMGAGFPQGQGSPGSVAMRGREEPLGCVRPLSL